MDGTCAQWGNFKIKISKKKLEDERDRISRTHNDEGKLRESDIRRTHWKQESQRNCDYKCVWDEGMGKIETEEDTC